MPRENPQMQTKNMQTPHRKDSARISGRPGDSLEWQLSRNLNIGQNITTITSTLSACKSILGGGKKIIAKREQVHQGNKQAFFVLM